MFTIIGESDGALGPGIGPGHGLLAWLESQLQLLRASSGPVGKSRHFSDRKGKRHDNDSTIVVGFEDLINT